MDQIPSSRFIEIYHFDMPSDNIAFDEELPRAQIGDVLYRYSPIYAINADRMQSRIWNYEVFQ